jgi:hypothetical protein
VQIKGDADGFAKIGIIFHNHDGRVRHIQVNLSKK